MIRYADIILNAVAVFILVAAIVFGLLWIAI